MSTRLLPNPLRPRRAASRAGAALAGLALVVVGVVGIGALAASPAPLLNVAFDAVLELPADPPDVVEEYGFAPSQRRELWFPDGDGPHPAVVLFHGGCWLAEYGVHHVRALATALRAEGFVVVAPEYRRVGEPGGGWPGTFEDVGAALDGALDGAAAGRVDPDRLAVAGHSAGGHLALWLAARAGLGGDGPDPQPPVPALVVGLAAITDPEAYARGSGSCQSATPRLLGGSPEEVPARYVAASPVRLPAPSMPVVLLEAGADAIVPAAQGDAYVDAHGARTVALDGAGHFDLVHPGTAAFDALLDVLGPLRAGRGSAPRTPGPDATVRER